MLFSSAWWLYGRSFGTYHIEHACIDNTLSYIRFPNPTKILRVYILAQSLVNLWKYRLSLSTSWLYCRSWESLGNTLSDCRFKNSQIFCENKFQQKVEKAYKSICFSRVSDDSMGSLVGTYNFDNTLSYIRFPNRTKILRMYISEQSLINLWKYRLFSSTWL